MNVVVNDLMTSYARDGKGPAIVFLHGWGDNSSTFAGLTELLKPKYTILSLDLPGFGGTEPPKEAWELSNYADFIKAWLDKVGAGKVHAMIAHSNGGAIAIKGLSDGSLNADRLVLLASAGVRNHGLNRKTLIKATAKSGKVLTAILPEGPKSHLRENFYKSVGSEALMFPQLEETFRKLVGEDIQGSASKLKLPTLLVYGDDDKSTPPHHGKLLNQSIAGSNLVIVPGAGHFLHHDQSQLVGEIVADFLAEAE